MWERDVGGQSSYRSYHCLRHRKYQNPDEKLLYLKLSMAGQGFGLLDQRLGQILFAVAAYGRC